MNTFEITRLNKSSIWPVYRMKDRIEMSPSYQREGDIWTKEKKQLLIDTILNGFDVPKLYMHRRIKPASDEAEREYALIDGKQRLNAIFEFIDGGFALADNFVLFDSVDVDVSNMKYSDVAQKYPDVKSSFDAYPLDIVVMETNDIEMIEDMFSRLNEAVPLNAAEKRNALPGPIPKAVRDLVRDRTFFAQQLPFSNSRYRHYDLAAKMLLMSSREKILDTKKSYVDAFFKENSTLSMTEVSKIIDKANVALKLLESTFTNSDPLLRSIGMVTLYFLTAAYVKQLGLEGEFTRQKIADFEAMRRQNREVAEKEIGKADYALLEFDRFTQSPNDGIALRFRLGVIDQHLFQGKIAEAGLVEPPMAGIAT